MVIPVFTHQLKHINFYLIKDTIDISLSESIIKYSELSNKEFNIKHIDCRRLFKHFLLTKLFQIIQSNTQFSVFLIDRDYDNTPYLRIIQKIQKLFPICIIGTDYDYNTLKIGDSGIYSEFTAKFLEWNVNKKFIYSKCINYCQDNKLTFLTEALYRDIAEKHYIL